MVGNNFLRIRDVAQQTSKIKGHLIEIVDFLTETVCFSYD